MTATTIAALFDPENKIVTSALTSNNMTEFAALISALESNTLVSDIPPKFETPPSDGTDNTLSSAPPDPMTRHDGDYTTVFSNYQLEAPRSPIDIAPQFPADLYYHISLSLQRQPGADLNTLWPTNANPQPGFFYGDGAPMYRPGLGYTVTCEQGYGGGVMSYKQILLAVRMWGAWTLNNAWRALPFPYGVAGCDMRMRLEGMRIEVPILAAEFRVGQISTQGIGNGPENVETA